MSSHPPLKLPLHVRMAAFYTLLFPPPLQSCKISAGMYFSPVRLLAPSTGILSNLHRDSNLKNLWLAFSSLAFSVPHVLSSQSTRRGFRESLEWKSLLSSLALLTTLAMHRQERNLVPENTLRLTSTSSFPQL